MFVNFTQITNWLLSKFRPKLSVLGVKLVKVINKKKSIMLKNILSAILLLILCNCTPFQKTQQNIEEPFVVRNIEQLKQQIKANDSLKLIPLQNYIRNIQFDWKYADTANFTHQILYHNPIAFLRMEAAEKLKQAALELEKIGLGFKVFDAYRPYAITKKMWQIVPDENYAANPTKGSGHNRGAAIDLTLYSLQTGQELLMPTIFDEFSEKAHHDYMNLPNEVLENRKTLKTIMLKYGFVALNTEWWHYSLPNAAQKYHLLDIDFSKLKEIAN